MVKKQKICLAASAGGHLGQLLSLRSAWEGNEVVFVSTGQMVREKLAAMGRTYIVGECNREHPIKAIGVMWKCLRVIVRERPAVVFSTGAALGFFMCFWGKLLGAKIVWLDSIANTKSLSLSGRLIRPFANLILSQWSDVAEQYKNVEYAGEVI
jgi:UDP-N-acetylglucosamine:LPS N-acetylglucosamine transferase